MVFSDTNRLMDACFSCKGHPGIEEKEEGKRIYYRGGCTVCCERGPKWETEKGVAVIEWNKQQRELKAKAVHIGDTKVIRPKK